MSDRPANARHWAEYLALRGAVGALGALGIRRAGRVGATLGALGHHPFGIRRAVVERQVAESFPEWPREQVERVALESYRSLGTTSIEAAVLGRLGPADVLAMFSGAEGWELIERPAREGRGVLLVTGHLGNWELGGAYMAARGVPIDAIARHMENPLVDGYLTRTRQRLGMRVVHDEAAVRQVPRAIRGGRSVAMLVDQGAVGLASTWVPFFGRDAKTPRGPAVFALRLDAPVVFGCALREPDGRYRMHLESVEVPRTGDRDADVDRIVAGYTATLERWVRRAPGQYFWQHRRWKHQRPAAAIETPSTAGAST
ncbi:MAG TPA: lysophospholipid acyltransferase family protein [Gemmatimonadaceae bacterium]